MRVCLPRVVAVYLSEGALHGVKRCPPRLEFVEVDKSITVCVHARECGPQLFQPCSSVERTS